MAKRHLDALAINHGASNPSGIAYTIYAACQELMDEADYTGTDQMRADPAIRLMVNQLSYLMGNPEMALDQYQACVAACEAQEIAMKKAAAELLLGGNISPRCARCSDPIVDDSWIDCTECKKTFCDNCYDTGKGDGCHCHA